MVQLQRPARRELRAKVVYWGPEGSGTTTNLDVLRKRSPKARRGELTTIACRPADGHCSGEFELMSLSVGRVRGAVVRLDLFTAPGCDLCEETRRLVLHAADAVVFVADSAKTRADANKRSFAALVEALRAAGRDPATFPIVFQWNKRELPGAIPAAELERTLNQVGAPAVHAVTSLGEGVLETLRVAARAALRAKDRTPSEERAPLVGISPIETIAAEALRARRSTASARTKAERAERRRRRAERKKAADRKAKTSSGRKATTSKSGRRRRSAPSDSQYEPALV